MSWSVSRCARELGLSRLEVQIGMVEAGTDDALLGALYYYLRADSPWGPSHTELLAMARRRYHELTGERP